MKGEGRGVMMYIIKIIVNIHSALMLGPVYAFYVDCVTHIKELVEHSSYQLDKPGQITGLREGVEDEFRFLNLGV